MHACTNEYNIWALTGTNLRENPSESSTIPIEPATTTTTTSTATTTTTTSTATTTTTTSSLYQFSHIRPHCVTSVHS
jgi:uncharacterized membrane protein